MIKREDVLSYFAKIGKECSTKDLKSYLKQKCGYTSKDKTTLYRILKNLESENILEKIDSTTYKVMDIRKTITIIKSLIKECERSEKISEWDFGGGFLSQARMEGVMLGIDSNFKTNKWQREISDVLLTRMATIFDALRDLMTAKSQSPEEDASYVREYLLEILPLLIGHKAGIDGDGYSSDDLLLKMKSLSKSMKQNRILGINSQEEFDKNIQTAIDWRRNPSKWKFRKKNQKFGMVLLPGTHILDSESNIEIQIKEFLEDGIKEKQTPEHISATILSSYDVSEVERVLQKYRGYYESELLSEIIKICKNIEIGFQVIYCLYDIDYCLNIIDGFENHGFKVGYYDTDGYYCGRSNPFFIGFGNGGFIVNSERPIGADRLLYSREHWLKSKSFYEDILEKTSKKINEIFHEIGYDKSFRYAMFSSGILLGQSPRFYPGDIDLFQVLKSRGYTIDANQIQEWLELGKKDAIDFVKKWVGPRRNYDYLFSNKPLTQRDHDDLYFEGLELTPISDDDIDRNVVYKEIKLKGTSGIFTVDVPVYSGSLPALYDNEFAILQKRLGEIKWQIEVNSGLLMRIGNLWFRPTKIRNYDNISMDIPRI